MKAGGQAALGALCVCQLAFIWEWMRYVDLQGGTRGTHYSVPISLQRAAVHEICSGPPRMLLFNETLVFPVSLQALAQSEPLCIGKQIELCNGGGCDSYRSPERPWVWLRYSDGQSAKLTVTR